jgi:hypothetical protein
MIKISKIILGSFCFLLATMTSFADDYPSILLKNKKLEVLIFLPNKTNSYYQAARFDWGSMVGQITYKNHTYLQQWKDYNGRGAAGIHDPLIPNTGTGLAEEFITPLGYDESDANGYFVKIGVGVLQKTEKKEYSFAIPYKIIDEGKRTYHRTESSLTITHQLNSELGYGYVLERTYELKGNKLIVKHTLRNTGKKRIVTETYSHNFMQFDFGAFNPDYTLNFLNGTINPANCKLLSPERVKITENKIDIVQDFPDYLPCFGMIELQSKKGNFQLQNKKTGMSVTMQLDTNVTSFALWMWQKSFCAEPRVTIDIEPNKTAQWESIYTFNN